MDPTTHLVYVARSFGAHRVAVIDGTTATVVTSFAVGADPFAVGIDPTTEKVYVANYTDGTVSALTVTEGSGSGSGSGPGPATMTTIAFVSGNTTVPNTTVPNSGLALTGGEDARPLGAAAVVVVLVLGAGALRRRARPR